MALLGIKVDGGLQEIIDALESIDSVIYRGEFPLLRHPCASIHLGRSLTETAVERHDNVR
ncbi:hypothetical protein ABZX77_40540 [Streptomyces sp. NPDC004237]|uniref:hypothetical protein n=1 Tax=Streptomyces sp. NPDC004237 TaxID=3154455 RepID=UPI0033B69E6F